MSTRSEPSGERARVATNRRTHEQSLLDRRRPTFEATAQIRKGERHVQVTLSTFPPPALLATAAAAILLATLTPADVQACGVTKYVASIATGEAYWGETCDGTADAIYGENKSSGDGVVGVSDSGGHGVHGISTTSPGTGVWGEGYNYGVYGAATANQYAGTGVYGVGNVYGVEGNSSAYGGLAVYGTATGSNADGVYGYASGSSGVAVYGHFAGSSGFAGYFQGNVYATGTVTQNSDARLKSNVKPLNDALDQLLQLKGVTFEWNDPKQHGNQTGVQRGFIAQDVEKVFPGWVGVDLDGFKTLSLQQIDALEVESIRSLKAENDALRARVARVEDRLNALENGRRPIVSGLNLNGVGFGVGGLALAGAFLVSRRKHSDSESA